MRAVAHKNSKAKSPAPPIEEELIAYQLAGIALQLHKKGRLDIYKQIADARNALLALLDDEAALQARKKPRPRGKSMIQTDDEPFIGYMRARRPGLKAPNHAS